MYYAVSCYDKKDSLEIRMATREKHLAFANASGGKVVVGGAMIDDAEQMIGSHLIVEASDRAALDKFLAQDPYAIAGLFERVEIQAMKIAISNTI
ncbi:MAG: YciI family protein [Rhizobiales bacterium]|nr:YciI family protein [Hyphomicrobiales bacterium]